MNTIGLHYRTLLSVQPEIIALPQKVQWPGFGITASKVGDLQERIPREYPKYSDKNQFLAVEIQREGKSFNHLLYNQAHLKTLCDRVDNGDFKSDFLTFWNVKMPFDSDKFKFEMLELHEKHVQSDNPDLLKLGAKSSLPKDILLEKIYYKSLDQIDFETLPAGTNLAFCYKNEDLVLYVAYHTPHLFQIKQWIDEGRYFFTDFEFYQIQMPSKVLFQHAKNLESFDSGPLELGNILTIPPSIKVLPAKFSCFNELQWRDKSSYLAYQIKSDAAGPVTLLYNNKQIENLKPLFNKLVFYQVQMPDSQTQDPLKKHTENMQSDFTEPLCLGPKTLLPKYVKLSEIPSPTSEEAIHKTIYPLAFSLKIHGSNLYVIYNPEHYERLRKDFTNFENIQFYKVNFQEHDPQDDFSNLFDLDEWDLENEPRQNSKDRDSSIFSL